MGRILFVADPARRCRGERVHQPTEIVQRQVATREDEISGAYRRSACK
jgi:hypothetical protein